MSENVEDTAPNEEVAAKNAGTEDPNSVKPSEEARQVALEDAQWREENPGQPRMRDAREGVGGESFTYLDNVGK